VVLSVIRDDFGEIMNRLGIIEVLRRAWKPLDGRDLAISVHAGDRNRESRGMRFIVNRAGEPLCCVKRLPLAGPYDPRAILATQKAFGGLKTVRVPEVLGWIQDDQSWFVVEQFVPNGMRLDDAVRLGVYSRKDAEMLVAQVLEEIYAGASGEPDAKLDEERILSAIETSRLSDLEKSRLRGHVFDDSSPMWHAPVWTTRDFLPRNILLSDGQPYLVDFDLACQSGLLGIDVQRVEFYTGWQIPYWPSRGASRDDFRTRLLFLILEENLQLTIAGGMHHQKWVATYGPEISQLTRNLARDFKERRSAGSISAGLISGGVFAEAPAEADSTSDTPPAFQVSLGNSRGWISNLRGKIERGVAAMRPGLRAMGRDLVLAKVRRLYPWQNVAGEEFKYNLDVAGEWHVPDQSTIVSGWCFSTLGRISAIRAVVNGQIYQGFYGAERQDVQKAMQGELSTANVGFWVQCPVRRGFTEASLEIFQQDRWVPLCRSVWRAAYFPAPREVPSTYDQYVEMESQRLRRISGDLARAAGGLANQPLISVVMPVYRSNVDLLSRAVESVKSQIYEKWELCIVDDASGEAALSAYLKGLEEDKRIKVRVRERNGNISAATNDGIAMSEGEWIAFLDHDDELTPDALYEVVAAINAKPDCDVIYTDQDKIDSEQHRTEPFFKPDWSPAFLRGVMYLGHLLVARRSLIREAGGCDGAFDGVQDFELALRLSERTGGIEHVPRILYHWRAIAGSVASDGAAKKGIARLQEAAVQAHLDRLGIAAIARRGNRGHRVQVVPRPLKFYPKISILIPTRDHPELIGRCLKTLFRNTSYPNFEVLIGDNETHDPEALKILGEYPLRNIPLAGGFHFARFINTLAEEASGEYLMLLNNDTEIVQSDWLEHLLLYAQEDSVGAAGALLTYEDGTVQHAGIILGPRGTGDHVMRGFPANCDGYMGSLACAREVTAVTAAAAMINRRKFMLVGGLCERFQRHYDDLDFCLALRSRGLRNICVSSARLVHYESRSRGNKYDFTDRVLLLDRWEPLIDRGDPYYSPNFDRNSTDYRVGFGGFTR
jgi:glycosyltransferase involved in cell wall biosynthesis